MIRFNTFIKKELETKYFKMSPFENAKKKKMAWKRAYKKRNA